MKKGEKQMLISGFMKNSFIDYPGKISAVVFTKGCNFRCPYCHNGDIVEGNTEIISTDYILKYLEKRKGLIDGVTITGGEPLLQNGLIPFIEKIKKMGYFVKLDTNGYLSDKLKEIIDLDIVDYIAMDIKNTFEKYSETAGVKVDVERIKESVENIKNSGIKHEFRTTISEYFHTPEDVSQIEEYCDIKLQWYKYSDKQLVDRNFGEPTPKNYRKREGNDTDETF